MQWTFVRRYTFRWILSYRVAFTDSIGTSSCLKTVLFLRAFQTIADHYVVDLCITDIKLNRPHRVEDEVAFAVYHRTAHPLRSASGIRGWCVVPQCRKLVFASYGRVVLRSTAFICGVLQRGDKRGERRVLDGIFATWTGSAGRLVDCRSLLNSGFIRILLRSEELKEKDQCQRY